MKNTNGNMALSSALVAAPQSSRILSLRPRQVTKVSYDSMRSIRKGIREEARFVSMISYTILGVGIVGMTILCLLDNYLQDFIEGMEAAGTINIGIPASASAIIISLCGACLAVFSIFSFLFLNASANELRKLSARIKEMGGN